MMNLAFSNSARCPACCRRRHRRRATSAAPLPLLEWAARQPRVAVQPRPGIRSFLATAAEARRRGDHAEAEAAEVAALLAMRAARTMEARA